MFDIIWESRAQVRRTQIEGVSTLSQALEILGGYCEDASVIVAWQRLGDGSMRLEQHPGGLDDAYKLVELGREAGEPNVLRLEVRVVGTLGRGF